MQLTHASQPKAALHPVTEKTVYTPDKFDIVQLGPDFAAEIEKILQNVQATQLPNQKHFIKPQTLTDLFRHYSQGLPVVGSVEKSTGNIAGLLLITPSANMDYHTVLSKYPSQAMEADTAIIGSVAAAPGYKGQMKPLLAAAEAHAASMGLLGVWAKVSIGNKISIEGFKAAGWQSKILGMDPNQGYKVSYLRKSLNGVAPIALPVFNESDDLPDPSSACSNLFSFAAPERR